jgi:hypothetical protein
MGRRGAVAPESGLRCGREASKPKSVPVYGQIFLMMAPAVAIAPDLGERYLDTIYHTNWVHDLYGENAINSAELTAPARSA